MRNNLFSILVCSILLVTLFSCATTSGPEKVPSDIPDWYLTPPQADDALYGVGSAKMSKLDTSRTMAISRARVDISFQVNTTIEAMIIDYFQESGVDNNSQAINFAETVSKQITEIKLTGTKTEALHVGKDGTVYALVVYPINEFLMAAEEEFVRNEDAAFAEFKAGEALKKLEAELASNPPRSNPVSE